MLQNYDVARRGRLGELKFPSALTARRATQRSPRFLLVIDLKWPRFTFVEPAAVVTLWRATMATSGLDPSVSDRVSGEIERFTEALEAAMVSPTAEALNKLEEATDHLMRATGRVLIELGRLRGTRKVR